LFKGKIDLLAQGMHTDGPAYAYAYASHYRPSAGLTLLRVCSDTELSELDPSETSVMMKQLSRLRGDGERARHYPELYASNLSAEQRQKNDAMLTEIENEVAKVVYPSTPRPNKQKF
jgi:hypothetical protein